MIPTFIYKDSFTNEDFSADELLFTLSCELSFNIMYVFLKWKEDICYSQKSMAAVIAPTTETTTYLTASTAVLTNSAAPIK